MKKKAITALALTAALAMGTAPAFAVDINQNGNTSVDTTSENKIVQTEAGKASGSTTLSIKTLATNIQATIPLSMTVAGPAEGGDLVVPEKYAIKNGSVYPISVTVKADKDGAAWSLTTEEAKGLTATDKINLNLQPAGVATKFALTEADSVADWKIAKKGAADTECVIALDGTVSATSQEVGTATKALKLVYTIAPTTISNS